MEVALGGASRPPSGREAGPVEAGEHEWRHGTEPTRRPDWFPRPVEEREVVRHKSYALSRETPDEAAFEMDLMDYDFHLFTDLATGEDSVVYRTDDTGAAGGGRGYRLAQAHSGPAPEGPTATPMNAAAGAAGLGSTAHAVLHHALSPVAVVPHS